MSGSRASSTGATKIVRTSIFKTPVSGRVRVRRLNLDGDGDATIELLPSGDYYAKHRWGLADAVAGAVAFVPPSLVFLLFAWRFVRFAFARQVPQA